LVSSTRTLSSLRPGQVAQVAAAIGEFNTTLGVLSVIFAVTWIGASAFYSRRG
jgi:hypothetical protein